MLSEQGIYYNEENKFLICRIHGYGVHPSRQGIIRHLRGKGHQCKGEVLKRFVSKCASLDLGSIDTLRQAATSDFGEGVLDSIPYLKVLDGWSCISCNAEHLTTSLELAKRHAASVHGRKRGDGPLWEAVKLQTFFQETKYRRYFRVRVFDGDETHESDEWGVRSLDGRPCHGSHHTATARQCQRPRQQRAKAILPSRIPVLTRRSYRFMSGPKESPKLFHPYVWLAAKDIQFLSLSHLDRLFKSEAFRSASEPLFDGSHVDAVYNVSSVFSDCENEPAFWGALLYSISQFSTKIPQSIESSLLRKFTIESLNECLCAASSKGLSLPIIGAIMILKTTAYKLHDTETHAIHCSGLWTAIRHRQSPDLPLAVRRALFWQDLFAAVFVNSERLVGDLCPYDLNTWRRNSLPLPKNSLLPSGFLRHQDGLPSELLDCVVDTLELQTLQKMTVQSPYHTRYHSLDSMQASIETRLVNLAQRGECYSTVAEATRLSMFLCCYCSWMEIWNDSLIPCKLAASLLQLVETSIGLGGVSTTWHSTLDLLLWVVLVASSVVELDQGHVKGLKSLRSRVLAMTTSALIFSNNVQAQSMMDSALADFVYCKNWVERRKHLSGWQDLEDWCGGNCAG